MEEYDEEAAKYDSSFVPKKDIKGDVSLETVRAPG
jgi:hypothetical protein